MNYRTYRNFNPPVYIQPFVVLTDSWFFKEIKDLKMREEKEMERTDCKHFKRTIPKSGEERTVGFRCLANIPTLGGCPPDCDKYTPKEE